MGTQKTTILVIVIILILGSIFYLDSKKNNSSGEKTQEIKITTLDSAKKEAIYIRAKEIDPTYGFINSEPFTLANIIGKKVILLDIWTYTCINCQRTLPYINGWYEKYKDQGLFIVGVHTPEFEFEKIRANVEKAVEQFGVRYPVVLDNDYKTWNAYGNRYWPRKYLIDIDGFVIYDHIGEGGYEETERIIQKLLTERKERLGDDVSVSLDMLNPDGTEAITDGKPRSPEIYFGAWRNDTLGNGNVRQEGVQTFVLPKTLKTSVQYFEGDWNITREYAESTKAGNKIVFKYEAAKVFMVASAEKPVRAKILIDGKEAGERAGADVDKDGYVIFQANQLYRLVEDPNGWDAHTLEIIPEGAGFEAFTFTFG